MQTKLLEVHELTLPEQHGLPVIVTRDDWQPRPELKIELGSSPLVRRLDPGIIANFPEFLAAKREPASARPEVARQMMEAMSGS